MSKRGKKKKHRGREGALKPRDVWVKLQAKGDSDGKVEFHFDKEIGEVFCPQALPGTVVTYQSYERDNGKQKVLYQIPGLPQAASVLLRNQLSSCFDVVAGIDTNTFELGGRRISIACSFASAPMLRENHDQLRLDPTPAFIFENVREGVNPELIAWYHFLTTTLPLINDSGRYAVALVVDSELARLTDINKRTEPYYREFFLPEGVQLIYASSDSGTDLPNKLIRQCDKGSRILADQIRRREIILPESLGAGWEDYSGSAYIA